MSSGWLIRRFIDPDARFAFRQDPPAAGENTIPFDMFGVEFSHHDDACTFETLVARFGISDDAVAWIAKIVHDLDLKVDRHLDPEAPAVGRLVEGLRRVHQDDGQLLEAGIGMFEALYRSFDRGTRGRRRGRKTVP